MKMTIEALLLIVAALQDHRVAADGYPLDMALNSVDDQYEGCTEKMADLVKAKYLEKETSWINVANYNYKTPEDNLTQNHSAAIYTYTNSDVKVHRNFNRDVLSGKEKYKTDVFLWYSLHFLLTEAIQILKKTQNGCFATYRGTNLHFDRNVLNKKIRLGFFASSTFDRNKAESFGNVSCFEIHTCEGADISKYSKFALEEEVLIPPYETFRVSAVKTRTIEDNLWCENVYMLESTGKNSALNCALVNRGDDKLL
ncbi:ecto-ADP-ribosyltransferase 5-like [Danio aesculapii]|uniref:ecto-ADP-ribosyltransferase 5-like n=1 Tax=Danio aesculapii TaxID=1142201 RepID=UPI0024BFB74E|nr:ecto-ADP-ribosyltransferase 5-like [Danio aesculapii]